MSNTRSRMKKILLALVILVMINGCTSNVKKKNLEKRLNEKYDTKFKIEKIWTSKSGYTSFTAYPKDNPDHLFEGRHNPTNSELTDSYIESFVAGKMSAYLTELFQEIIPGSVVIVKPSGVRFKDIDLTNTEINMDEWLNQDYENLALKDGSSMQMTAYMLIPQDVVESIDFVEYKNKVIEVFSGEMKLND